jgi:hypothetical protein
LGKTTKEKKTNHEQKQAKELKISVKWWTAIFFPN